jgi:transposase InsO family protein
MIDQVTGLPPIEGFSSYLTIVDLFSGYCTAYPLKKGTSEEIAKILEENIIRNFGAPNEILSDNAANLNGPAIKKLLDFYGV